MTRRDIGHASELRHRPMSPTSWSLTGRWLIQRAERQPGGPDDRGHVTWSLVLRHAVDGHVERVDADAHEDTRYREGREVDGKIVVTAAGRMFRRSWPHVGTGRS